MVLFVLFCWNLIPASGAEDRIQEAIKRGREVLLRTYPRTPSTKRSYPMGRTALPVAALLRAGIPSTHPAIVQSLEELEKMSPQEVYSVSCYLMALDALVQARVREARQETAKSSGTTTVRTSPVRNVAEGPVRSRMEEMIRWLLGVRNPGFGTWHYRNEGGHDYSNTQFAVLGLSIGFAHRIAIPKEVFQEIARQFSTQIRERDGAEFTISYLPPARSFLAQAKSSSKVVTFRRPVGGWGYLANERLAYASMTAAGASNLLVAQHALGRLGPAAQESLECALGWIALDFERFLGSSAFPYYTLYSLEKVGDLGDIVAFNGHDWYRAGADYLLGHQGFDGSWGETHDTSFALLFLTRATRPALRAVPTPRVMTQAGGSAGNDDLVRVEELGGSISAREFFEYLAETGDRSLLKIAAEVAAGYPIARQGEMVPWLLALWAGPGDPIGGFARKALAAATGESYGTAKEYERWFESYRAIRAAEGSPRKDPQRISELLAGADGLKLKGMVMEMISRAMLSACIPAVTEELLAADASHRARAAEVLARLAGETPPGLPGDPREGGPEAAAAWRGWWRDQGGRIMSRERIRKLIAALWEGSGDEAAGALAAAGAPEGKIDPEEALDSLAGEGRAAVPLILEEMSRPEFPARLLLAIERISSRKLGLRPAAWKEWWEAEAKRGG